MADLIPVADVVAWRWRCALEGTIILGGDLLVAHSPATTRLSELGSAKVDREKLRCKCGGSVVPLAPIDDK